jgi:DNA mismatch repair protein MSH6
MAKVKEEGNATPAKPPPSLKKQSSSSGPQSGQRTIQSFFSRAPANSTPSSSNGILKASDTSKAVNAMAKPAVPVKKPAFKKTSVKNITPVPSSDAMGPSSSQENENGGIPDEVEDTGLPSPSTPAKKVQQVVNGSMAFGSSPSRRVCKGTPLPLSLMLSCKSHQAKKVVSYVESDDEDDEDAFDPAGINTQKRKLQRKSKVVEEDDDDEDVFIGDLDGPADDDDGKIFPMYTRITKC